MSEATLILSGKGGVGKSVLTSALSCALAKRQLPTAAVDLDMGLRSLDMLLGLENSVIYDLLDVSRKDCKLSLALVSHPIYPLLKLLPASQLGTQKELTQEKMQKITEKLKRKFSCVLLDAPAGLGKGVLCALPAVDHAIVIVTPDDISIRDAEKAIALVRDAGKPAPRLIVNRVHPKLVKKRLEYSPQVIATTLDAPLLGYVPDDPQVQLSLCRREPLIETDAPAKQAIDRIAARLLGASVPIGGTVKRRLFARKEEGLSL